MMEILILALTFFLLALAFLLQNLISSFLFLQAFYDEGEYIIRQGARGDTFFIIKKGAVSQSILLSFNPCYNSFYYQSPLEDY